MVENTQHTKGTRSNLETRWKSNRFVRYGDGTHNLWTIDPDGNNPTKHTNFRDGTQIQGLNWIIKDKKNILVMALYRNHKQEIWSYELETNKWMQWTENELDETDPYWDLTIDFGLRATKMDL